MCEYCGNTGLCYGFLATALVWIYRKGMLLIKKLRNRKSVLGTAVK